LSKHNHVSTSGGDGSSSVCDVVVVYSSFCYNPELLTRVSVITILWLFPPCHQRPATWGTCSERPSIRHWCDPFLCLLHHYSCSSISRLELALGWCNPFFAYTMPLCGFSHLFHSRKVCSAVLSQRHLAYRPSAHAALVLPADNHTHRDSRAHFRRCRDIARRHSVL
jgi:hypothetical protein